MQPEAQREAGLLQAATQLRGTARASFLQAACQGEPALRQRLETVLAARERPGPSPGAETEAARSTLKLEPPVGQDDAVGQVIGRYRVLQRIGEGGCGVVYVAEQTEPVRRRVALKVIKLGVDTRHVVARFEAQLL